MDRPSYLEIAGLPLAERLEHLGHERVAPGVDLAGAVRKGGTLLGGQATLEPDDPLWVDFARSMAPVMKPGADFIADLVTKDVNKETPFQVLDVAAGHGIFGIEIATRHPQAQLVALARYLGAHGGQLPRSVRGLEALAGIGPYCAAALTSLHRGQFAVIIDANVVRVISRYFGLPISDGSRRNAAFRALATRLTPEDHHAAYKPELRAYGYWPLS